MAHNFVSRWTPSQEEWKKLPELHKIKGEKPASCCECSHGCGLSLVSGTKVWVDFQAPLLIVETSSSPCSQAPASAATASASGPATTSVRHPRLDIAEVVKGLQLLGFGKTTPDPLTFDERYTAQLSDTARTNLTSSHTMDAPTIKSASRRLVSMLLAAVAANLNALYSATIAPVTEGEDGFDFEIAQRTVVNLPDPALSDRITASSILINSIVLLLTARGLLDRTDVLATLQNSVFKLGAKSKFTSNATQWLRAMHTALRGDFAAIRDVLERRERFFSPLKHLEQNPFTIFGAALVTNNGPAARAFFRTELPREVAEAKKIGWKPADPGADDAPAAAAAGAAAAPSPVRTQPKGGHGAGDSDAPTRPSRKRKRGAGKGAGKGGHDGKKKGDG
jgi:hypothetical protein